MPITSNDIHCYNLLRKEGEARRPNLTNYIWLVKTPAGYMATGHDATYTSQVLGKPIDKLKDPDKGHMTPVLVIPPEKITKAGEIIGIFHQPVVLCDPGEPVLITVLNSETPVGS